MLDIFRFTTFDPDDYELNFSQGIIINDIKEITWVERYREAGDFQLVGNLSSGIKDNLPIGSLISHVDSHEVMVVENHEITEATDGEIIVRVSGRSFESYFEHRIVGENRYFVSGTTDDVYSDYEMSSDRLATQIALLFESHAMYPYMDVSHNLGLFRAESLVTPGTGPLESRVILRGNVYTEAMKLLNLGNYGVKTVRPGPWSPLDGGIYGSYMLLGVYEGVDRTNEITFSLESGEVQNLNYLWSNKSYKNAALVLSTYHEVMVFPAALAYGLRTMVVDASDLDKHLSSAPGGGTLSNLIYNMENRGKEAIANQKGLAALDAEATKDNQTYKFREDYDLGDIVTVVGDYDVSSEKRITEYVEVQDEFGSHGYPTFDEV